jgi:sugar phosphate isomerase/epimerase
VYVAASTDCFAQMPLSAALKKLFDLEYTRVEIVLRESGNQLKPSQVQADLDSAVVACRDTHRLTPVAYLFDSDPEGPENYKQFSAVCKLAKATKVVIITVRAGELGTPFNAEIERLRELVKIATVDGVVVGLKTESERMTHDPNTAKVLCDNVKGLCLSLDPSHYHYGQMAGAKYDHLFPYVCHTQLRDTNKKNLQVKVGQGGIEYGRIISQLQKFDYQRALCVNIDDLEIPDIDHLGELRKMRLLLESLL